MLRDRVLVIWAVLLLAVTASTAVAQQALELNVPVSARYVDAPVAFTVNAEADQTVLIVVTSSEADFAIELYDPLGNYVAGDNDSGDGINPALGISFPQTGAYAVNVVSYDGTTRDAAFTILMQPLEIVTEAEIVLGEIVRGIVGDVFPTFTFTVEQETILLISPLTYNFPALMELSTEDGTLLISSDTSLLKQPVLPGRYRLALKAAFGGYAPRPYYALLVTEAVVEPLERGETRTVNAQGERARFYTFEGRAGDVVDIVVDWSAGFGAGAFFSLVSPSGVVDYFSETTSSTSFVSGVELREDGLYQLEVLPFSVTFRAPFTIAFTEGQIIEVSATPTTLVIDTRVTTRQLSANVVEGRVYRLTLVTNNSARSFSVFVETNTSLTMSGGRAGSIEFIASSSGTLVMSLRADSTFFGDQEPSEQREDATLTITLEEVNQ
ncbi:MAG: PPC domain-containing protein [Anaerolinea sp.]